MTNAPDWPLTAVVNCREPEPPTPPVALTVAVPRLVVPAGTSPSLKLKESWGVEGSVRLVTVRVTSSLVTGLLGPVAVTLYFPAFADCTAARFSVWFVAPVMGLLLKYHW